MLRQTIENNANFNRSDKIGKYISKWMLKNMDLDIVNLILDIVKAHISFIVH